MPRGVKFSFFPPLPPLTAHNTADSSCTDVAAMRPATMLAMMAAMLEEEKVQPEERTKFLLGIVQEAAGMATLPAARPEPSPLCDDPSPPKRQCTDETNKVTRKRTRPGPKAGACAHCTKHLYDADHDGCECPHQVCKHCRRTYDYQFTKRSLYHDKLIETPHKFRNKSHGLAQNCRLHFGWDLERKNNKLLVRDAGASALCGSAFTQLTRPQSSSSSADLPSSSVPAQSMVMISAGRASGKDEEESE